MVNVYEPEAYKITKRKDFTSDTVLFRVQCKMKPEPGQFVEASVFGTGEAPISVCSYSDDYVDLLIRNVGNVTSKLFKLTKGSSINLRGPYGKGYPMKDMAGKDIIIIAGGTGVAPPRSVIQYIEGNRAKFHNVHLFLGFRSPEDILFKEDIDRWSKAFHVLMSVDKCADPSYGGKVCFVTDAFSDSDIIAENSVAVLCGPPIMMKVAVERLKAKGFADNQLYLSFERHMKCGLGKCGHCVVAGKYMCKDGPVFNYEAARDFYD
jgi:anaerobic sulfite reductase subunit B